MKGYIKMEVINYEGREGLSVDTHLEHVGPLDKLQLVDSLCRAIHVAPVELKLMADMLGSKLMEELTEVRVLKDEAGVLKQEPEMDPALAFLKLLMG